MKCQVKQANDNQTAANECFEAAKNTENKFIWTQFYINDDESVDQKMNTNEDLKKVVKNIYKLYNDYLNDDSILIVCLTGRNNKQNIENNDHLKGKCFLKHKNKEADNLENEIEQLYFKIKENK
jgi:hypothetical protein